MAPVPANRARLRKDFREAVVDPLCFRFSDEASAVPLALMELNELLTPFAVIDLLSFINGIDYTLPEQLFFLCRLGNFEIVGQLPFGLGIVTG